MAKLIPGIIRGNMIELLEPHGLADGEKITLEIRTHETQTSANGIVIATGETVDGPFWDEVLDEFYQRRKKEVIAPSDTDSPDIEHADLD
jgi:hypothetical protein